MTEMAMPNPVELFEKTTSHVKKVVAGIKQEQLDGSTPCAEWNVRMLVNHLIGGAEFTSGFMTGSPPEVGIGGNGPDSSYSDEIDAGKLSQAYDIEVDKLLEAANSPGALEAKATTPFGEMVMGELLVGTTMDNLIHGWDLAKATGQDTALDPEIVQTSYNILVPEFGDQGRQGGVIGPVVSVPDDASTQDKMLAWMGRQP